MTDSIDMMSEVLFLLLPLAALSGWLVARTAYKKKLIKKQSCNYEPEYYKGLNFLLNEQPDKAIDVFINLLEVDTETVETHLALGSLFRKRGEVDRAIRIHQNLIARPSLNQEQRANALLELGQDYMNAGLYDRAENLFSELYESGKLQKKALENLREIYQQEKVWDKCLSIAKKLESISDKNLGNEIAHYYCEISEEAFRKGDSNAASENIRKAKQADPSSVRASMMEAARQAGSNNCGKALKLYTQIIENDPMFIPEIIESVVSCYKQLNNIDELASYLDKLFKKTRHSSVLRARVNLISQQQGNRAALEYLQQQLLENPKLQNLQLLIQLQMTSENRFEQDLLPVFSDVINEEISARAAYSCRRCGFAAKTLHWQCPGCRSWGTIKPAPGQEMQSLTA